MNLKKKLIGSLRLTPSQCDTLLKHRFEEKPCLLEKDIPSLDLKIGSTPFKEAMDRIKYANHEETWKKVLQNVIYKQSIRQVAFRVEGLPKRGSTAWEKDRAKLTSHPVESILC